MTTTADNEPRVLIVVTRDHGEFGFAASFLKGQRLARSARVLLPQALYGLYRDAAPAPTAPYQTLADILAAVDEHQPDLVCLFSGYLFENGGLLSCEAVNELVRHLGERGCRIATSDPFLGLGRKLTLSQIDARMFTSGQPAKKRWLTRLLLAFKGPNTPVVRLPALEHVTHLYPTAIPPADDDVPRATFFNPAIIRPAATAPEPVQSGGEDRPPSWLFVLSKIDLECQFALHGRRGFERLLVATMWQTLATGRLPTLIAPAETTKRVARKLPALAELLPGCPFEEFERRLLGAEYVFYWNAFSFSLLARLANLLPVFLFDRGHLARTIRPYHELARSCHYGGWDLPYLDQRRTLGIESLAPMAAAQQPALRTLREHWSAAPTPDQVVHGLLRSRTPPAERARGIAP